MMKRLTARLERALAFAAILPFAVIALSTGATFAADEVEDGFHRIFDGKTLEGWDGDPRFWKVEDGAITGSTLETPTRGNTFLIWKQGDLDDFELRLEYRIAGGNSGVQYRSFANEEEWGKWVVGGYQADIDSGDTWSGALYGERFRGVLAKRGQKTVIGDDHEPEVAGKTGDSSELQAVIKKDGWNDYRITARGYEFVHEINGRVMIEAVDKDEKVRRRSGSLALQLHAGPSMKVQFRNIRLRRFPLGDRKKLVFVAGRPSHGYGAHEHNAGCLLLAEAINENVPSALATVYENRARGETPVFDAKGWPKDPTAFDNADGIVLYMDGGGGHPVNHRLDEVGRLMERGIGLACLHYAVEVPKEPAGARFLDWIGGYFETWWSVNPHWTLEDPRLADHPITRGVEPFEIRDEWYYHMRFRPEMEGVTPILSAIPPDATRERKDGPHSGNKYVRARKGLPEVVAWARERPDGGRGFGFTGGHFHRNWQHDEFRQLVLNALVWIAGAKVPEGGVESKTPAREELEANQDYPKPD